jgi:hypothetical protein
MLRTVLAIVSMSLFLSACGGTPSLVGNWRADDGTGMKVIMSNGMCSGMYYSRGEPLDIGGGMRCSMSSKKGSNGRYSLVVTQPPNEATFYVAFDGNEEATVYDSAGIRLFTMTRQ